MGKKRVDGNAVMRRTNMNFACLLAFALTWIAGTPQGWCTSPPDTIVSILRRYPERGANRVPVNSRAWILLAKEFGEEDFEPSRAETRVMCADSPLVYSAVPADVQFHPTKSPGDWQRTGDGWVYGSPHGVSWYDYFWLAVFDPLVPLPANATCRVVMEVPCSIDDWRPDTIRCDHYSYAEETWVLTEFTTGDTTDIDPPSIPGPIRMEAVMYRHSGYKGGGRRWAVEVSFPDPGGDFRPEELLFFLWLKSAQEGYPDRVMVNWWEDAFLRDGRVHIPFSMGPDFKTVRCVRFWAEDPVGYQTGWSTTQCFDPSGLRKDWYCLCGTVGRSREHRPVFFVLLMAILLVGITRRR